MVSILVLGLTREMIVRFPWIISKIIDLLDLFSNKFRQILVNSGLVIVPIENNGEDQDEDETDESVWYAENDVVNSTQEDSHGEIGSNYISASAAKTKAFMVRLDFPWDMLSS